MPLLARRLHGGGAGTFTVMLACLGAGAIVAALLFPRWRERFSRDQFVRVGTLAQAALSLLIVYVPELWLALPSMVFVGMAWISVANSLTVAAQVALPDWVRARGMSIYQMALMGGSAAGALLWGQVASWTNVRRSGGRGLRIRHAGGRVAAPRVDRGRRRYRLPPGARGQPMSPRSRSRPKTDR